MVERIEQHLSLFATSILLITLFSSILLSEHLFNSTSCPDLSTNTKEDSTPLKSAGHSRQTIIEIQGNTSYPDFIPENSYISANIVVQDLVGTPTVTGITFNFQNGGWSIKNYKIDSQLYDNTNSFCGTLSGGPHSFEVYLTIQQLNIVSNNLSIALGYSISYSGGNRQRGDLTLVAYHNVSITLNESAGGANLPKAIIDIIEPNPAPPRAEIYFKGHGVPANGSATTITAYEWTLNTTTGIFSNEAEFKKTGIALGNYTVYFRVQDSKGNWSVKFSMVLLVAENATSTTNGNKEPDPPLGIPHVIWDNKEIIGGVAGGISSFGGVAFAFYRTRKKRRITDTYLKEIESASTLPQLETIKEKLNKDLIGEKIDEREYMVIEKKLSAKYEQVRGTSQASYASNGVQPQQPAVVGAGTPQTAPYNDARSQPAHAVSPDYSKYQPPQPYPSQPSPSPPPPPYSPAQSSSSYPQQQGFSQPYPPQQQQPMTPPPPAVVQPASGTNQPASQQYSQYPPPPPR